LVSLPRIFFHFPQEMFPVADESAAKRRRRHSAASRNRIRNCPQMTQMHADGENGSLEFTICVNLRHLRAEVFSYSLMLRFFRLFKCVQPCGSLRKLAGFLSLPADN
jgi:hypothetical protein